MGDFHMELNLLHTYFQHVSQSDTIKNKTYATDKSRTCN